MKDKNIKRKGWGTVLHILIIISFVVYLAALLYFTIGKSSAVMINGEYRRLNLVPFKTISTYMTLLSAGRQGVAVLNLVGNIILFMPMAVYLPYFFKFLRKFWKDMIAVLVLIILIEIVEYVTGRGSLDIDDVILNLIGGVIGYGIWKLKFVQHIVNAMAAPEEPAAIE